MNAPRWTVAEVRALGVLLADGYSYPDAGRILGRGPYAVNALLHPPKREKLGLSADEQRILRSQAQVERWSIMRTPDAVPLSAEERDLWRAQEWRDAR